MLALLLSISPRAVAGYIKPIYAANNIYCQQIQVAKYLHQYYNNSSVVANDIGAITYFTNIRLFDLIGLANNEILSVQFDRGYTAGNISSIINREKPDWVIVYDIWFKDAIPKEMIKIMDWKIPYNIVCGSDMVSFYASNDSTISRKKETLYQYSLRQLPRGVLYRQY